MKIIISRGYGSEVSRLQQIKRLDLIKKALRAYPLPVSEVSSQRETGGQIYVEVSDDTELSLITRVFSTFAEDLAWKTSENIFFDIEIPALGFEITIAGVPTPKWEDGD